MLTIIHGTDTASSRKYFFDLKEEKKDAQLINGTSINLTDLVQLFEGGELFDIQKDFFIDSLIGKRKKGKELNSLINIVNKSGAENNIYIWEGGVLTPASLKQFKNAANKVFKLPQTLFTFLDQIKPGNGKNLVKLFHQTIESTDPEMVFFMIIRQVRLMIYVKEPGEIPIEEIKRMTWQMGKLESQASAYETDELKALYNKLFGIEKGLKTGSLPLSLTQAIDLLLLNI